MLKRLLQRMTMTDWFPRVGPKIIPRMDRAVHWLTRGKGLTSDLMIPTMLLTTTGRKSGQPRSTPLACLPEDDGGFLVVGSNFGRESHPAWSGNLLAHPRALVHFRGKDIPVTATLLTGEARAEAWPRLLKLWPVFDHYTARSGRDLRVFRLSP
ncbi:nitroreductase family deazaflavin-dependent oxidoreductase [Nonomuraea soli]|uniref:Deazaflavin-dependent oxidoreductase (Nitroreductase family) n=1 Tax=Nonomuraea soli TaxID=1032476 RepID=A0A7W0HPJ8_9ACTN|nr:nitroreductase family deazaflavin-dependent oxidoreductase [Nonomuraea soli]MBA2890651.1 deazaflavin-dependent oxidoreductase (nitroreductase family) [Nonomuraea soli]